MHSVLRNCELKVGIPPELYSSAVLERKPLFIYTLRRGYRCQFNVVSLVIVSMSHHRLDQLYWNYRKFELNKVILPPLATHRDKAAWVRLPPHSRAGSVSVKDAVDLHRRDSPLFLLTPLAVASLRPTTFFVDPLGGERQFFGFLSLR